MVDDTILKNDWDRVLGWQDMMNGADAKVTYVKNENYFRIKDFVTRKDRGSLLLSGVKGSGKTTAIIKLLLFVLVLVGCWGGFWYSILLIITN